ncbi:hypothetical protein H2198_008432 [Neophaeococcomyces mojaviensis]|uniref:Uncharacterized protein n=1 Tax=Neophaeococcomyces mojaviensis TaxID=3383035 RepID=A0ACC2ZXA5_9EURO|nr:hypothetical protein H2198_008432 [Knufia sp. JES_112]
MSGLPEHKLHPLKVRTNGLRDGNAPSGNSSYFSQMISPKPDVSSVVAIGDKVIVERVPSNLGVMFGVVSNVVSSAAESDVDTVVMSTGDIHINDDTTPHACQNTKMDDEEALATQKEKTAEDLRKELRDEQAKAVSHSSFSSRGRIHANPLQSQDFKTAVNALLEKFLPAYVLELDPRVKNPDQNTPTKIELEVAHAIANAELSVYLSYCHSLKKKLRFLEKYHEMHNSHLAINPNICEKMEKLAKMHPQKGGDGNDTVHETKPGSKYVHKKEGATKSNVHELLPLLPKKLMEAKNGQMEE